MAGLLSTTIAAAAGVIAVAATISFLLGRERPKPIDVSVQGLEALLVLRALVGVGQMLGGQQEVHSVTHIGYLIASVAIIPITAGTLEGDRSRWSAAVIAVACLAVVVIVIRLQMTATADA